MADILHQAEELKDHAKNRDASFGQYHRMLVQCKVCTALPQKYTYKLFNKALKAKQKYTF